MSSSRCGRRRFPVRAPSKHVCSPPFTYSPHLKTPTPGRKRSYLLVLWTTVSLKKQQGPPLLTILYRWILFDTREKFSPTAECFMRRKFSKTHFPFQMKWIEINMWRTKGTRSGTINSIAYTQTRLIKSPYQSTMGAVTIDGYSQAIAP